MIIVGTTGWGRFHSVEMGTQVYLISRFVLDFLKLILLFAGNQNREKQGPGPIGEITLEKIFAISITKLTKSKHFLHFHILVNWIGPTIISWVLSSFSIIVENSLKNHGFLPFNLSDKIKFLSYFWRIIFLKSSFDLFSIPSYRFF